MFPSIYSGKEILAKDLQDLIAEIKSARITSVIGGSYIRGVNGTCIKISPTSGGGGGGSAISTLPFAVLPYTPETPPTPPDPRPVFEINPVSYIWQSPATITRVIVSPFNTPGQYPGFYLPDPPAAIVVTVTFDESMAVYTAILEQIKLDEWPENAGGYPWPIERDFAATGANYGRQKKLYIVLAEVSTPEDGRDGTVYTDQGKEKKVIQLVKSHLLLDWQILDGLAAKIAIPWQDQPQLTL